MTSVTLNFLVFGEDPYEKTLPVDIDTNKNIGALKKAIKNDINERVSAMNLRLFKVDIPLGETRDEDVVSMLKLGDLSIGLEMNNNLQKISVYFSAQPVDTNLHILVQLPPVANEQPVAGLLLTEEIVGQIKFLYENKKSESESTSLSTINGDRFQNFLNFSNLRIRHERFCGTYPSEDIDPYRWTYTESHKSQLMRIINYLNKYLTPSLPDEVVIEDVANKKDFLKICKGPTMPFNISGGTDIILVEKQCVAGNALKPGIHAIFELKKAVEERHIFQAVLEMIIADCYVSKHVKVFGVLTDLKDIWNIFWLSVDKEIIMVNLTNRRIAFETINKMVRSDNPRIEGISNTERMKYTDLFDERFDTPYDDIAPMEDFEEEMDENEVLMHKTKKVINALKYNPIFSSMLE